jgi:transposase-like protein
LATLHPNFGEATMDDLSNFCCQNSACPDYGKRNHGNLSVCGRYGEHRRRLLYCKSCKDRFSERKGTPLFDSRLPPDKVISLLAHIAEGVGVRSTACLVGVAKDTVTRYCLLAGDHAEALHDELVAFSPQDHGGAVR